MPEEAYEQAAEHFPDRLLAQLVVVITAISAWNRVMLAGDVQPPPLGGLRRTCRPKEPADVDSTTYSECRALDTSFDDALARDP